MRRKGLIFLSMYFILHADCASPLDSLRLTSAHFGSTRRADSLAPTPSYLISPRLTSVTFVQSRLSPRLVLVSSRLVTSRPASCLSGRGQYNLKTRVRPRRVMRAPLKSSKLSIVNSRLRFTVVGIVQVCVASNVRAS